jgi:hypothetical protein
MTPDHLPQLLGLTNTDEALIAAIMANASGDAKLTPKRIQDLKADFVMLRQAGLVMSFSTRETHTSDFGPPRGDGPRVLSGLFYYPMGSEEVDPYEGIAPLAAGRVLTREDALAAYGEPSDGEEEDPEGDDVVEWEQWHVQGLELTADYDDDEQVVTLTVSLPMVF